MKMWHMRLANWITKVRNLHSGYVIFVGFFYAPNFALTRTQLHIVMYVYSLSLVLNFVLGLTRRVQIRLISHIKTRVPLHVDFELV